MRCSAEPSPSQVWPNGRESAELLQRLAETPHALAEVDEVIRHGVMTMVCATLGDMDGAADHCRQGIAGSDALRLPVSRVQFRLTESLLALWHGRFEEAEQRFDDAIRLREQTELYVGWSRMGIVVSRWKQGRIPSLPDDPSNETDDVEQALVAVAAGDTEMADRLIAESLARDVPVTWTSHGNWTLLAHAVADARLTRHAGRLIELLTPLDDLVAIIGQVTVVGPVPLALARLHALIGDNEAARRELAAAVDLCERSGGWPSLLRCRLFALELDGGTPADVADLIEAARAGGLHGVVRDAQNLSASARQR